MLVQGRVLARNHSSATTHGLGTLLPILGGAEHFLMDAPLPPEVLQPHGLLQRITEELKARVLSSRPGLVPSAELACGLLCPRGGSTLPAAAPAQIPTARWAPAAKTPASPPLGSIRHCLSPRQCAVIS